MSSTPPPSGVASEVLERIDAHQHKSSGGDRVRRLAGAWCPDGRRLIAAVYVVDDDVWLWLERARLSLADVPAVLLPDGVKRDGSPRRAVWLRDVSTPHPPSCRCEPVGGNWVTCRCCSRNQRIVYGCADKLVATKEDPLPDVHNVD